MAPQSKPFGAFPSKPAIELHPTTVHLPQRDIDDLNNRLDNIRPIRTTWENSYTDAELGMKQDWIDQAIAYWRNDFDW